MKIYKTFEEYLTDNDILVDTDGCVKVRRKTIGGTFNFPISLNTIEDAFDAGQFSKQEERDQLKQRINSLESIIKRVADDIDSTFILPTAIAIISELGWTLKEQPK